MKFGKGTLFLLSILSAASIFGISTDISMSSKEIAFTEYLASGDPSFAEDLTLTTGSQALRQLHWQTEKSFHNNLSTAFSLEKGDPDPIPWSYGLDLFSPFQEGVSSSTPLPPFSPEDAWKQALADQAPEPGVAVIVDLAEVLDTYPLDLDLMPDAFGQMDPGFPYQSFQQDMASRFSFPVLPGHQVSVVVEGDRNDPTRITHTNVPDTGFDADLHCLPSSSGFWFLPELQDTEGTLLDYSATPGYGVYLLTLDPEDPSFYDCSLFCPLSEDSRPERFCTSPDGHTLFCILETAEGWQLLILHDQHPEWRQTLPLKADPTQEHVMILPESDFFLLTQGYDGVLYQRDWNGHYQMELTCALPQEACFLPAFWQTQAPAPRPYAMAYENGLLALATRPDASTNSQGLSSANSIALSVFQRDAPDPQPIYACFYVNSLDRGNSLYLPSPVTPESLSLTWDSPEGGPSHGNDPDN